MVEIIAKNGAGRDGKSQVQGLHSRMRARARALGAGALAATLSLSLMACSASPEAIDMAARSAKNAATAGGAGAELCEAYDGEVAADGFGAYSGYLPEDYNTEEYAALRENGFISVATNPFSTFSADVDSASYCNLRRMIRSGSDSGSIPSGAVRIEEMLNYFHYDYAAPSDGKLFGTTACIADCPWNSQTKLLVLGLQTAEANGAGLAGQANAEGQSGDAGQANAEGQSGDAGLAEGQSGAAGLAEEQAGAAGLAGAASASAGNNLVFLIDVSGSMDDPDKLDLLKDSFAVLIDNLNDSDTVSIVTYSGEERVVLDGASASQKSRIMKAVRSLEAGGCTNGQAGMARAYELAEKHFIAGGNNRIVLASDGDLNVGITSESDLSDFVAKKRESGVYLSVLGFGAGNYKDTKMETIADDGNGAYYYIDCLDEAERVFGEDLCATMCTVANDVKLQLEFNPAYVKGYRQIGYENRALNDDDFKDDSVDAGEVGAGHSVTVAYEIVPADSAFELGTSDSRYGNAAAQGVENGEWCTLSVRYKPVAGAAGAGAAGAGAGAAGVGAAGVGAAGVGAGVGAAVEESVAIGDADYTTAPSEDWRFAAQVIEFGMLVGKSTYAEADALEELCESIAAEKPGLSNAWGATGSLEAQRRAEFHELVDLCLHQVTVDYEREGHSGEKY